MPLEAAAKQMQLTCMWSPWLSIKCVINKFTPITTVTMLDSIDNIVMMVEIVAFVWLY